MSEKGKNESIWKKGVKWFNRIPKIGKQIILVAIVIFVISLGVSSSFKSQTNATMLGLRDVGS